MLTSEFLLSCVPKEDIEFREHLLTQSPQGQTIIEHMVETGISLQTERESYELIKQLQARHAQRKLAR